MGKSAKSVFVFGLYLVGMGLGLAVTPNLLLGLLGFPPPVEVWSRVVGVLALLLAFYYIQAARVGIPAFFQWTVYARLVVFVSFSAFVLAGFAGPILILLGSVDLLGAAWTAFELRKENMPAAGEVDRAALRLNR